MHSKRVLLSIVLAAATALCVVAAAPAGAASSEESQFISSHNSIRAQHGRSSLSLQSDLTSIARSHSVDMANSGSIWHNPHLGSEVKGWDVVGENVGMGPSVGDLMDAFMNSPDHRSNILDTDYNQFGIGVADRDGTIYVTVVFAHRGSSVHVSSPSTTRHSTSSTAARPRARTTPAATAKPKAVAKAAPAPASAPASRTVSMLLQLNNIG